MNENTIILKFFNMIAERQILKTSSKKCAWSRWLSLSCAQGKIGMKRGNSKIINDFKEKILFHQTIKHAPLTNKGTLGNI